MSAAHISPSQIAPPDAQCAVSPSIDNITAIKTMTAHHQQAPTTTALHCGKHGSQTLNLFIGSKSDFDTAVIMRSQIVRILRLSIVFYKLTLF